MFEKDKIEVHQRSGGIGFAGLLTIVFVLLKAFNVVDWSWWIVFLPVIISVGILLIVGIIAFIIAFIIVLVDK